LQAKIIMKPTGRMFLNNKAVPVRFMTFGGWLRGFLEIPLSTIRLK